jgi:hypothetical protein
MGLGCPFTLYGLVGYSWAGDLVRQVGGSRLRGDLPRLITWLCSLEFALLLWNSGMLNAWTHGGRRLVLPLGHYPTLKLHTILTETGSERCDY